MAVRPLLVKLRVAITWSPYIIIYNPIWKNDHTKMISSSRRIEWWKDLSFKFISFRCDFGILSHFLPPEGCGYMDHSGRTGAKPPLQAN